MRSECTYVGLGHTEAAVAHSEEEKANQPTPAKKRASVQQLMRTYYRMLPDFIPEPMMMLSTSNR
jgi:hypothetical protein